MEILQVIMVGTGGVGKSALTLQFMYDEVSFVLSYNSYFLKLFNSKLPFGEPDEWVFTNTYGRRGIWKKHLRLPGKVFRFICFCHVHCLCTQTFLESHYPKSFLLWCIFSSPIGSVEVVDKFRIYLC